MIYSVKKSEVPSLNFSKIFSESWKFIKTRVIETLIIEMSIKMIRRINIQNWWIYSIRCLFLQSRFLKTPSDLNPRRFSIVNLLIIICYDQLVIAGFANLLLGSPTSCWYHQLDQRQMLVRNMLISSSPNSILSPF